MAFPILGLHHVTATVDQAQPDLDFCLGTLGLRLVKKTVNFDNHHVYHFYYGTELGAPGTIWTTFPYHGRGVRVGVKGAGQVTTTSFSVPRRSLPFWTERLSAQGLGLVASAPRFGEDSLLVTDPSGLLIELVEADDDREPWDGGHVASEYAVRGLHSVSMTVREPEATIRFMASLLGFSVMAESPQRIRVGVNGGGAGRQIDLVLGRDEPDAVNGLGTVHHVAMALADDAAQLALREELIIRGLHVTPVMDRQYFKSIYFREPNGVLFEVATASPGFAVDETPAELGRSLKLPPWEEANRPEIERGLTPVHH